MSGERGPLVAAGDRITVSEGDYQLGTGPLRMRVLHVLQREGEDLRELCWVQLMGVEITPAGTDGRHRTVFVRVAALVGNPPQRTHT